MARELARGRDAGGPGLSRRSGLSRARLPHRGGLGGRSAWGGGGAVSGAPRRAARGARPAGAVRPRVHRAAGRALPVDLERERAPLCARQRGHGWRAPRRPRGARGADGGGPTRRGAAAAHAERDASLICPSGLQTSAFPPSALQSPRGRAQPRAAAASPATRRPARRAGSGGREGVDTPRNCPPDAPTDGALRRAGALTSGKRARGRGAGRPLSEAGKSVRPEPRSCQRARAGGGPRCPPAPRDPARPGNQPWDSPSRAVSGVHAKPGGRQAGRHTTQDTDQLLQKMCPASFLGHLL